MKRFLVALGIFGLAAVHVSPPASAQDEAIATPAACAEAPPQQGKSRQRFDATALMVVAAELESQGEKNFKLAYEPPTLECLVEQVQLSGMQVDATYNPWTKGRQTLLYRFAGRTADETREVLVLYNGSVGLVAKGHGFHVSETRNGIVAFYAMYREEPTFAAAKELASQIFAGTAKPLMAVRWPEGAAEGELVSFDSTRLK